MIVLPETLRVH